MKTIQHLTLIAAVTFFASCAKNDVVEPALPTDTSAATETPSGDQTTPLLESGAEVEVTTPTSPHTTPLLDADTPAQPGPSATDGAADQHVVGGEAPLDGKASFAHNLEIQ